MNSSTRNQQARASSKKRSTGKSMLSCWSSSSCSETKEKQTNIAAFFLPTPALQQRPTKRAKTVTPSHSGIKKIALHHEIESTVSSDAIASKPLSSTNKTIISSSKQAQPKKKKATQMYLDLGQKSFGKQTVCSICGTLFVHGVEEDRITHERVCRNYKQGVSFRNWNQARIVSSTITTTSTKHKLQHTSLSKKGASAKSTIIEIRASDARSLRQKVQEIKAIAHQELGFAPDARSSPLHTSFVCVQDQRAVGLLLVEPVSRASLLHPHTLERLQSSQRPCTMGIHTIWVHAQYRHRQIASQLVDAARDHFQYGGNLPLDQIAFSSPTQSGIRFATSYLQRRNGGEAVEELLIYDCDRAN